MIKEIAIVVTVFVIVILCAMFASTSLGVTILAWGQQHRQGTVSAATMLSDPMNSTQQNLLTYQNSSYGVTFQYPSNWVKQPSTSTGTILKLVSPNKSTFTLSVRNLNNTQLPPSSNLNSTALLSQQTQVMTQVFSKVFRGFHPIETSSTMLAGNPAEKLVFALQAPQLGGFKQMNIFTIKGQKEFIISYGSRTATYPVDLPLAQHLIDSLQITK